MRDRAKRFESVDRRFDTVDRRFESMEERMDLRFMATGERITSAKHEIMATFRGDLLTQTRTLLFALVAAIFTAVSMAFGAAQLV